MKKTILKALTAMIISANVIAIPIQAVAATQDPRGNAIILLSTQDPRGD